MISPTQYFAAIADKRRELDGIYSSGFCGIVSLLNLDKNTTAGSISEVSTALAAKSIVNSTHRLQTAEEIKAYEDSQSSRRKQILADDRQALRRRINATLGAT